MKTRFVGPEEYRPISAWGYVGYSILYSIPVVGFIIWLINAIGAKNRNVRNHARSFLCKALLGLIIGLVLIAVGVALSFAMPELYESYKAFLEQVAENLPELATAQ